MKKLSLVLGIFCIAFLVLWFSGILPKAAAKSVAEKYIKNEVLPVGNTSLNYEFRLTA